MKIDEYNLIVNKTSFNELPEKRGNYILKKWVKKGWIDSALMKTHEYYRVENLILNLFDDGYKFCNRVVNIYFDENRWGFSQSTGVMEDIYDSGFWFYTTNKCKKSSSYFLDYSLSFEESGIAYIEYHPNPHKIWRRLNYLMWKKEKKEDYFHDKYSWLWCKDPELHGKCTDQCQCKFL